MAITFYTWRLSITLKDWRGLKSSIGYDMLTNAGTPATFVEAQAKMNDLLTQLAGVTNATPIETSISYVSKEASPSYVESNVANKAVLSVTLASDPNKLANIFIPSPENAIFVQRNGAPTAVVDLSNTELGEFIALFNGADSTFPLAVSDRQKMAVLERGSLTTRQRRFVKG